jgi:hypothetical protein
MVGMMSDKLLSENEIDEIVIAQADDNQFWEDPIYVSGNVSVDLVLPPDLVKRAAFFARLHDMPDMETWLRQIIRERVHFEEAAFVGLKRVMESRPPHQ